MAVGLLPHGSLPTDAANEIVVALGATSGAADPLGAAKSASYLMLGSPNYQVVR